jgi:hypothetical protein
VKSCLRACLKIYRVRIYRIAGQFSEHFASVTFFWVVISIPNIIARMEEDRAQVDLGIAMDVEESLEEAAAQRQPKKRFVGRRQAAESASKNGVNGSVEDSGAIQSKNLCHLETL